MRSQWFVIHTLSGQEQKVKESIEKRIKAEEMGDYIKEVLVPMEKVVEVRNQKKTVSTRKLWPGYVFVDMVLLDEDKRIIEKPWYFIQETQGVIGFVGGEPPTPTPDGGSRGDQEPDFGLGGAREAEGQLRGRGNREDQQRSVPELQRGDRGSRAGAGQTEGDRQHFRAQHARRVGILAGGKRVRMLNWDETSEALV